MKKKSRKVEKELKSESYSATVKERVIHGSFALRNRSH